jgi:long-subunit acyl-CoA synthetase (AMP-forming)
MEELRPILAYFYEWESKNPDRPFLRQPFGAEWRTLSYSQAGREARCMAAALKANNYPAGSHIGILSKNCYHWILADLAIQMAGHVSVPFFPNLSSTQLADVLRLSDVRMLFAGKLEVWHAQSLPEGLDVVSFPHYPGNEKITQGETWDSLVAAHPPLQGKPLPLPDALWTILFTSGTTGTPKGVMLSQRAAAEILANEAKNNDLGIFKLPAQRFFSFLPLNHVAERIAIESACILTGGVISFGESLDTFAANLQGTRPTFFFAVPRIWSKFQSAIFGKLPPKRLNTLLALPLIGGLIRKRIQKALGLDQAGVILTGAAPTSDSLKDWYRKLGMQLREVYGMTETSGAITVMPWGENKPGSVGKAVSSVGMKIDAETDELLVRLPWMMSGYYNEPELSEKVLRDGWLHTGDKARIDEEGYVFIIGRVKDSFKTSKGKYIAPAPIEAEFMNSDLLEQVCVVGTGLSQPLVLVVLSEYGQTVDQDEVKNLLLSDLNSVNAKLAGFTRISTVVVVVEAWDVENGFLTPTLKVRRQIVEDHYSKSYLSWHEDEEAVICR